MTTEQDAQFVALYERWRRPIAGYAYRLLSDADQMDDCVQDTFLNAYRALDGGTVVPEEYQKAWLFRIAHNVAMDVLRNRTLIGWLPLEAVVSHMPRFEEQVADRAMIQQIATHLSAEQTACLWLWCQGYSYAEIMHRLHITRAALGMRLVRARQAFAAHYATDAAYDAARQARFEHGRHGD